MLMFCYANRYAPNSRESLPVAVSWQAVFFGILHYFLPYLQQTPDVKTQHLPDYSRPGEQILTAKMSTS